MAKTGIGRMTLALPLMLGVIPSFAGYQIVTDWREEATALTISGAFLLLAGVVMLASALALLVFLGRRPFPLWTGGIASLLAAGILVAATVSRVLPCSGST